MARAILGLTPLDYGLWFIVVSFGYMAGNGISGRFSERAGLDRMIGFGTGFVFSGSAIALLAFSFSFSFSLHLHSASPCLLGCWSVGRSGHFDGLDIEQPLTALLNMTTISCSFTGKPMTPAGYSEDYEAFNFGQALLHEAKNLRKRDRTRADIYNAGCSLLNRLSPASLKVSEICREAGVAHGTFYIYFPNRKAFVASLLLRFVDYLQAVMHRASKSGGTDTVRTTTKAYYRLFEQNAGMMKCLINHLEEFPSSLEAFQKLNLEWATTVVVSTERKLAQSDRAGKISRDELFRRAYALGGMVDQYLTALLLNRDQSLNRVSQDKEAVIETLSLIWNRGMAE